MQVLQREEVGGNVFANGGVRTTTGLDRANLRRRQRLVAREELGVLAREDVIRHDAEPGPENRPTSKKARKAETAAASAAAVIGVLFSNHANVTLGGAAAIDENALFEDTKKHKPAQGEAGDDDKDKDKEPAPEPVDSGTLVPWIQLK